MIPITNCTYTASGNDVLVTGTIDWQTVNNIMDVVIKDYKTDLVHDGDWTTGDWYVTVSTGRWITHRCFFEIADDYLSP